MEYCSLKFALDPQQTVTVEKELGSQQSPSLSEDQQHMYDALHPQAASLLSAKAELEKGFVLFGYTTDPVNRARLSSHDPTTNLSLFVVRLP